MNNNYQVSTRIVFPDNHKTSFFRLALLFFLCTSSFIFAQTQIGQNIDGEVTGDRSGSSVSMSSDGTIIAIGAPGNDLGSINGTGQVKVFSYDGSIWTQLGDDINGIQTLDSLGVEVSLSNDGTIVAVGGGSGGFFEVYAYDGTNWIQVGNRISTPLDIDNFATSMRLSGNGNRVIAGGPISSLGGVNSGTTRIYENLGGIWIQVGQDIFGENAGDRSGGSVSISSDGETIAIGARLNDGNGVSSGHTRIYRFNGSVWNQLGEDIDGQELRDESGTAVSLSLDGNIVAISSPEHDRTPNQLATPSRGHVRVFSYNGTSWLQLGQDIDGDGLADKSGEAISLASNGNILAIGARNKNNGGALLDIGHTRIFKYNGVSWGQVGEEIFGEDSGDESGTSVGLSSNGDTVVIGAPSNNAGFTQIFDVTEVPSPEIDVLGNGISISNGDTTPDTADGTSFNSVCTETTRTFTIDNSAGTESLNLTDTAPNFVGIFGSSDFTITSQPPSNTIPAGSFTTFDVTYTPVSSGTQIANIVIQNNDANEAPYTFRLADSKSLTINVICPGNLTIACDASTDPTNTGEATAIDTCDMTPSIDFTDAVATGTGNNSVITRTWTATDANGNTSSCDQIITVEDTLAPAITCPADLTIACDDSTDPTNTGEATAIDTCDMTPSIDFADAIATGTGNNSVITRTWTATDANGNASSCDQIITVEDTLAPAIICPADLTIACDASTDPTNTGEATAIDTCDMTPSIDFTDAVATGTGNNSVITRTWTATDANGNASSCDQIITVEDTLAPIITCPADVTIACDDSSDPTNTGAAIAMDVCDMAPSIGFSDAVGTGTGNNSVITRTWTATDANGNASSCDQIITVEDTLAPIITCPADLTIACDDRSDPTNTGAATASDTCDMAPSIGFSDAVATGTGNNSVITRTWTATDANGNTSSCDQIITVEDTLAPAITCPADLTIACDDSTDPTNTGEATAIDTCDMTPSIDFADAIATGTGNNSVITRTWTATDANGNASSCDQIITVEDTLAPAIICPADLTIACDASTDPTNTGEATVTDSCDMTPSIGFSDAIATGTGNNSVITRTWTATDANGNASSCDQIITVEDTLAPTITCPADLTIACDASTDPTNTGEATATDSCDMTPSIGFSDAIATGTGNNSVITRTWTATDANGNTSSCDQIITVEDTLAPTITCPADLTIVCDASTDPTNTGEAASIDTCDITPSIDFSDAIATGTGNNSVITRTWTATDANGNASSCDQIITVEDTLAPAITCPADLTIACDASTDPTNTGEASSIDTCDMTPSIGFSDAIATGTGNNSVITRTWTATDANGNVSSCDQIITVEDTLSPTITCPADLTIACDDSTDPTNTGEASSIDTCDMTPSIGFSDAIATGTGNNSVITRTWTATDANGNVSSCDQIITVEDTLAPVIVCPADLTIACDDSTDPTNTGEATAIDTCDMTPVINFSDAIATGTGNNSVITRTWTATDANGNTSSCDQIITVEDTLAPVIVCPADLTIACDASTDPTNTGEAASIDTCDMTPSIGFSDAIATGTGNNSVITRTWTATDANGNTSSCDQIITVEDTLAPAIICQADLTIACDASTDPTNTGEATAIDTCDMTPSIGFSDAIATGTGNNSVITRTWTATDANGNTSSCDQIITVEDTLAPAIICPADLTIACDASTDPTNTGEASSIDTCDMTPVVSFSDVTTQTSITRTWTATDANGNNVSCDQIITLEDTIDPTIICPDDIISDNELGICGISAVNINLGNPTTDDNCGVANVINDAPLDFPIGETIVTWTVTDLFGNTATCAQLVTVNDTEAPEITCPLDVVLETSDETIALPDYTIDAIATDNCAGVFTITQDPAPGTIVNTGSVQTIILTATDESGNESTCSFDVDVLLGIQDIASSLSSVSFYPNPAQNTVTISNPQQIDLKEITIYDLRGRAIQTIKMDGIWFEKSIELNRLESATYLMIIKGNKGTITKRLIIE